MRFRHGGILVEGGCSTAERGSDVFVTLRWWRM
jgi:hypothetical protein